MDAMNGGKKNTKKRGGDKDKKGGAVELGSILAPAVLLGLQQIVKDGAKDKRRSVKRGGAANEVMFRSAPAPLEVAPLVPAPVTVEPAGKLEVPPSVEQVVVPQEAPALPTAGGSKPIGGGAKGPCSGGKKDKKKEGGKKKDDDKKDGGKKDKKDKKDGGKKDKKKEGGKKKDDDKKDGGKKKEKKGPSAEGAFGVSGRLGPAAASMNVKGKAKLWGGDKDKKYGGALELYAKQLEQITRDLDSLMRDD